MQIIILLYLIDNNEQTSWMILMGSGIGVVIEAWKVRGPQRRPSDRSCLRLLTASAQITKAVDISLAPAPAGSLLPYKLDIKGALGAPFPLVWSDPHAVRLDKHVLSEDEKKTQEYEELLDETLTAPSANTCLFDRYDKLAFRIVSYFTIPCLAIYTVYSLLYETHRGWYSFVISTLTSFVYMFGFVRITRPSTESGVTEM